MNSTTPFKELEKAEMLLDKCEPTNSAERDYDQLAALLIHERILDSLRIKMFEENEHGSQQANDYLYRERLVRHRISSFALRLDTEVTDRITGESPEQKSVVAMCIRNRAEYPAPTPKA
ncbi:MAG: hypothetical protein WBB94_01680 [Candidatus Saccharimonadaceae bacterium]